MSVDKVLGDIFKKSFTDFFDSHKIEKPTPIDEQDLGSGVHYVANLSFFGEGFTGSTTLLVPEDCLKDSYPAKLNDSEDASPFFHDWASEIINIIVGNLKRLVTPYGVSFEITTPTVIRGKSMSFYDVGDRSRYSQHWQVGEHILAHFYSVKVYWEFDFDEPIQSEALAPGQLVRLKD